MLAPNCSLFHVRAMPTVENMIYENEQNVSKYPGRGEGSARYVAFAIFAAALYALSTPLSKVLLADVPSSMLAGLLYLGAGVGMAVVGAVRRVVGTGRGEEPLSRSDAPYAVAMVVLDIVAPILLMTGLSLSSPESTSLLNNFEIVATALVALVAFREPVSGRLWVAIAFIVGACTILSVGGVGGVSLSPGSLFVLGASMCWGIENNCTNRLSSKDPMQVVVVKGFGSGAGAIAVALGLGDALPDARLCAAAMLLGFLAYGLSIFFYVHAQRGLGAARTSAYYAFSPFIGVAFAWAIFCDVPTARFLVALALMAVGAYLAAPPRSEREPGRLPGAP